MSLRQRLTLLYSALMGGILIIFGAVVYFFVLYLLRNQVDVTLAKTVDEILKTAKISEVGQVQSFPAVNMAVNSFVQIRGVDGYLQSTSASLTDFTEPFDSRNLQSSTPVYSESYIDTKTGVVHLRVLTVPLMYNDRKIAIMQVAVSLTSVDNTRSTLLYIISLMWGVSVLLAGLASWFTLGRALAPLEAVVETAEQINRADDLSRRIPYRGPEDEVGSLIASFNQTLERLESLFTSQQRFLADVSHELRTPLTVIKGNVDLMRRMKSLDDESLTSIDQEAGRLTRMVSGLLMLAQAESGQLPLNMKPVDMDMLVTEVFQEMSVLAGNKVKVHLSEIDQLQVNGDRDRLKQVFINLTANAIQYTPQGGDVFLSLTKVGDQARIICRDTGPGIPAEDLPHIFERFYRAEKSRTRGKTTGFGLGLSITQWIVERHGGRIEVASKEGGGTTFAIWIPLLN